MLSVDIYSGAHRSRKLKHTLESSFHGPLLNGQDEPAFIFIEKAPIHKLWTGNALIRVTRGQVSIYGRLWNRHTTRLLYCRFETTPCNFTGFRQVWGPCCCFDSRHERRGAKYRVRELDCAIRRAEDSWDELGLELKAFLSRV